MSALSRIWLYASGLMSLIAGCAGPMGTIHSDHAAGPAVTSFDGSYQATLRVTDATSGAKGTGWCDSPGQPIISVANGQFSYAVPHPNIPGNATPVFQATIAQDGSFFGTSVNGTISGHVVGAQMNGDISGGACVYTFDGQRV